MAQGGVVGTGEIRELDDPGHLPGGRLLRLAACPASRSTRSAASSRTTRARCCDDADEPVHGRLRDRLDQARPGRPDRPHQVRRAWRRSSTLSTTRPSGGRRPSPSEEAIVRAARGARHRVHRPRRLAPSRRARDRLGAPDGARASRSSRATRWCTSPAVAPSRRRYVRDSASPPRLEANRRPSVLHGRGEPRHVVEHLRCAAAGPSTPRACSSRDCRRGSRSRLRAARSRTMPPRTMTEISRFEAERAHVHVARADHRRPVVDGEVLGVQDGRRRYRQIRTPARSSSS